MACVSPPTWVSIRKRVGALFRKRLDRVPLGPGSALLAHGCSSAITWTVSHEGVRAVGYELGVCGPLLTQRWRRPRHTARLPIENDSGSLISEAVPTQRIDGEYCQASLGKNPPERLEPDIHPWPLWPFPRTPPPVGTRSNIRKHRQLLPDVSSRPEDAKCVVKHQFRPQGVA